MASHLADLTRLMSQLSHHVAMPDVLLSCPEMLPHLLDFMQQESAATAIVTVSTAIVSIVTIVTIVAIVSTAMVKDAVAVSGAAAWLACTRHTHMSHAHVHVLPPIERRAARGR